MNAKLLFVILAVATVVAMSVARCYADNDSDLPLDQDHTGEINPDHSDIDGMGHKTYDIEQTITLKAGDIVSITVIVPGSNRLVGICLMDQTRAIIGRTGLKPGSNALEVQANSSSTHTVQIRSTRIGDYTVHVTLKGEETEESIQRKIDGLRKELEIEEQKLKELQEKDAREKGADTKNATTKPDATN